MAEQKAAVEVKQEGDFKIKSKPKKPKNLGAKNDEPVKMDFTKPESQGEITPDVVKMSRKSCPKQIAILRSQRLSKK